MERNYSVAIRESSMELSAKERIMFKDTSAMVKVDEITKAGPINIKPIGWVILDIHNEKATPEKDYVNFVIITDDELYVTGSESFWNSFWNIYSEMEGESEEWELKCYRLPSKNRQGKDFLTCSIV